MKRFIGNVFASIIGFFIAMFLMFFISLGIIGAIAEGIEESTSKVKIKDNSILEIKLDYPIVDRTLKDPFNGFDFSSFKMTKSLGLNDIIKSIERAKEDNKIKGIYLNLNGLTAGLASIEEIRNALINFKTSGKWIVAYSENYSQMGYYLASVADEIYIYPEGNLSFLGLRTELAFFKNLLDKLDIEVQVIRGRNNKFKSAVEPFMYDHMSDANREQISRFQKAIWNHILQQINTARNIDAQRLNLIADSLLIQTGSDAVNIKMVDKTLYPDEFTSVLKNKLDVEEEKDIHFVSLFKYSKSIKDKKARKKEPKIAVIYALGSIESGEGDDETIGSDRIARAIKKARQDTTVKAVVMRVNSPGGSALASDVIWREVILCKKEKPFIVSMGDVAASGGYYISCAADKIFADPTTITGSIGVFGVIPNTQGFLNNKLGVNIDKVTTNAHSDMMTIFRPLDDFEKRKIQASVEHVYNTFLTRVAEGRGMTKKEVDNIGQGRVWSGVDAKEIGLIDEFGSLNDAIKYAAAQAQLESYKIQEMPKQRDPFEKLLEDIAEDIEATIYSPAIGKESYETVKHIKELQSIDRIQARLPFGFAVKY